MSKKCSKLLDGYTYGDMVTRTIDFIAPAGTQATMIEYGKGLSTTGPLVYGTVYWNVKEVKPEYDGSDDYTDDEYVEGDGNTDESSVNEEIQNGEENDPAIYEDNGDPTIGDELAEDSAV
ncbi:hypothetical protein [Bacillus massilinigeriensis]|uniref:hypothetical protein n=1 Tax=Bacillus mediterraneensis TaxID=1805474 RepID=UPI0008F91308|nr:hypothetical protein [Bacillus mediterraneensis]